MYIYLDLRGKLVVNYHTWVAAIEFTLKNEKQRKIAGKSDKQNSKCKVK